nr:retrovirus-related Pol polyprotein LINE-1 [Tanacetum cinerariifolium]
LLALDIHIKRRPRSTKMAVKSKILWKNLHGEAAEAFKARVTEGVTLEIEGRIVTDVEQMWNRLANTIREVAKETLGLVTGTSRTHICRMESWWLTEERYKEAKGEAKKVVIRAKGKAYEDVYKRLDSKEGEKDIYKIAKAKERRNMDIGSMRFIKDEDRRSIVDEDAIRRRWMKYFSAIFNEKGVAEPSG